MKQYLLAQYDSPGQLLCAVGQLRLGNCPQFDVHSPFPVHGVDKAMGLSSSKLPWITLLGGVLGGSSAMFLQWWINVVDYPLNISGKPFFSLPAFVPVTFELTILLATIGTIVGMLALCRLPEWNHPLFESKNFSRVCDDGFFISIEVPEGAIFETVQNEVSLTGAINVEIINV